MRKTICELTLLLGSMLTLPCTALAAEATRADPVLIQFVQSVVDTNPRVQAAQAALEASGAYRDAASRPLYNPSLTLGAENADTDTRTVGVSQRLDWSGKRKARTAVAASDRLVAEARYRSARWAITVELLDGLALHQTGVERNNLAESRRSLMDDFATLAKLRFEAGDLNQVEMALATLAFTDARIRKATAGTALAEARQAVRNLTPRVPPEQWPTLSDQMPVLPASATDAQTLVLALPEVMAAQQQVESANAVVSLRERQRKPDPTISLSGGRESGTNLVGVNVSIPLFIRNRFNYEVLAAMAERRQARQISDDILQRAYARLTSAIERYELSRAAWGDWELTGQSSLTSQTEQLRKLWQAGEISTTDYLVQLRQTIDVQESALDLRFALWRAWFEWLWASGQVDEWLGQGDYR
ncbi:MAG: TolC family protein [Gammaproteobacteria bacterium]|nr:TolC family protein [Gammaproteobacteria bacterium]